MTGHAVEVDGRPAVVIVHPYDDPDPAVRTAYLVGHADGYRTGQADGHHAGWADADAHAEQLHRRAAAVTEAVARDITSRRPVGREQLMSAMAAAGERLAAQLGRDRREAS